MGVAACSSVYSLPILLCHLLRPDLPVSLFQDPAWVHANLVAVSTYGRWTLLLWLLAEDLQVQFPRPFPHTYKEAVIPLLGVVTLNRA
jgi:hypothetical protein